MRVVTIIETARYRVESYGRGWAYLVTRKSDGATLWTQDEDASMLREELESTHEHWSYDDVLCEYDGVFQAAAGPHQQRS